MPTLLSRAINKFSRTFHLAQTSGLRLCDLDGVKLMLDLGTENHRFMRTLGGFELELTTVIHRSLRSGDVFVDIGANAGWHTLSLLVRRPDVRMSYAFEPASATFALLEAGVAANGVERRCVTKRLALSDHSGVAAFKIFTGHDPMANSLYALADVPFEIEEVKLDTLDSQVQTFIAAPAVIKCDVEGAELDVLRGATDLLSGRFGPPPLWFVEANYETAGMAGFFPWQMLELAATHAPYAGFVIRSGRVVPLPGRTSLRHGDTLIMAIPDLHGERLATASHGRPA